ncbi:PAAR domain-containing protein [Burkholderia sp. BCC1988]|uniref:PAAR domain-containing protein n=1 Tax=Burkholderia sp. BCC1988 TaxID=2817443 RepID=UPI002AB01CFA|nr:PAAR domain-containing protein [Burkholderia sp. BCC1988]
MMRRYLSVDDQPETGGVIEPYSGPPIGFYGHAPAKIGARCYCNACKHTGLITKAGGSRRHIHHGTELALDGDILLCACPKPPRMVARTIATAWFEDMGAKQGQHGDYTTLDYGQTTGEAYDQHFLVKSERTGAPLIDIPYKIVSEDGREIEGRTDSLGRTQKVAANSAISATIHVFEEHAPLDPNWDRYL